ncbi:MAG TPA: hypothetical protein VIY26_10185, partial [Acidimicrobiales bacterium]
MPAILATLTTAFKGDRLAERGTGAHKLGLCSVACGHEVADEIEFGSHCLPLTATKFSSVG